MRYTLPSSPSSSISDDTFYSVIYSPTLDPTLINQSSPEISTGPMSDTPMVDPALDPFVGLSVEDKREILLMLQERRRCNPVAAVPALEVGPNTKVVVLPKWNGKQEDFGFYMDMLRTRVEKEIGDHREPSCLCIDIINTLPDEKKSRVANWFSLSKKADNFNWRELLNVFEHEFEDTQAQQSATELVQRMEQGRHQMFRDFLKEFEYQVALSGGEEIFTPLAKTRQLKLSLNNSLRRALIGVKLPSEKNYLEWVSAVKEIAVELESFSDYRPKNSNQKGTKIGPPKSGSTTYKPEPIRSDTAVDQDGDTIMTGTNAILAAIENLKKQSQGNGAKPTREKKGKLKKNPEKNNESLKPRAPWRSRTEFIRLVERGVCVRCKEEGHKGEACPTYRAARRPKVDLSQLEEDPGEESESASDSGKDHP